MSSINFDIYVGPAEGKTLSKVPNLFELLVEGDFGEIRNKYPKFMNEDLNEFFGSSVDKKYFQGGDTCLREIGGGAYNFMFMFGTLFDANGFINTLVDLEESELEAQIFFDQVGESALIKNRRVCREYGDVQWKWLSDPDAMPLEGEYVVVTGTLEDYFREDLESVIADNAGVFQKTITKKTTLLVVGSRPGASKIAKAKELGIRTIDEESFMNLDLY